MAITHGNAAGNPVRDTICNAVVDAIDAGVGNGILEFQTSGGVEVATLTFASTAFGVASSGTATAATITEDSSATGGVVAKFQIKDEAGGDVIIEGTAGSVGTEDIVLSSSTIGAGDTVSCSALSYSAPA